jgi:hypothetical protein
MPISDLYSEKTPQPQKVDLTKLDLYPDAAAKPVLPEVDLYKEKVKLSPDKLEDKDNVNFQIIVPENNSIKGQTIDTTTIHPKPTTDLGNLY